ncbi:MAG TPA: glutamine-hydrolyzing carbamoyl-phosphate synthase small subunit [Bacilli bacterium]|nr:glutamine-hydrolyzing carbamoyl-phosphate synthase small subunit [Bacilli bacterium]
MCARLILENGAVFEGRSFGADGESFGEVVFTTGMTGYQEILTDPSYCGQIVTMTYPLIGNYGVHPDHQESKGPQVRGFVVREFAELPSHWKNQENIDSYLKAAGIVGLADIDTRKLTKIIRQSGTLGGVITTLDTPTADYVHRLQSGAHRIERPVYEVTATDTEHHPGDRLRVIAIDYGMKRGILRSLHGRGLDVTVVPADTTAEDILERKPHGVFLSNGPGDPEEYGELVGHIKRLIGQVPLFGICLGHQLIAKACGARTERLPFGHRGSNHPVKDLLTGHCVITSQNHGYVVQDDSLVGTGLEVTHINLNDGSIEGLQHTEHPCFSVQYHPEARPGPTDSDELFDRFMKMMKAFGEEERDALAI